ncbi:MAG TPA: ATP-binding protein [Gammaproteobacteria bacterium]|jgi:protein-histidine pros-kinase|nr:ATP-binding protein [Gammaproteobacteria bacterium]
MSTELAYFFDSAAILEAMPDALLIIDKQGCIVFINRQTEHLFGYHRDELVDEFVEHLIPARFRNKHLAYRARYFSNPQERSSSIGFELVGLKKNGIEFPIEISLSPLETEGGLLALVAVRDVSDRKRLAEELYAKNVELEKAILAKDRFLATMSHELRTPLNAIIGFTGTLLMKLPGSLTAAQEKQLKTVAMSANHLLSIINDILDLAKIESGKVELALEKIDCAEVITDVISTLSPLAESKNISLIVNIPATKIYAKADRRALTQILINLSNNALKFTEKGNVTINMRDKKINQKEFVIIDVIDTGIGIQAKDKEKLFKAFEHIEIPGIPIKGTGLGLYVSKKLAMLMKARIEFSSEYGKGSCFTILIPQFKSKKNDKNPHH